MSKWNFAYFSFCPLPLVLILGTTEKSLILPCFLPPISYLHTPKRSFSFFSSGWTVPNVSAFSHRTGVPVTLTSQQSFAWLIQCLCCSKETRTGQSTLHVASPVPKKGGESSISSYWELSSQNSPGGCLPSSPQVQVAGSWSACPPGQPDPFLESCFPAGHTSTWAGACGYYSLGVGLCFSHQWTSWISHWPKILAHPIMAAQLSSASITATSFV